jgi:hypothetical protein
MKRMRILGLALVAVFALAAVVVSSASASPAYFECKKGAKNLEGKYTGLYTNKLCSEESGTHEGKYELQEGLAKGKSFKTKGGAGTLFVVIPPGASEKFPGGATVEVKCTSAKGGGHPELPNKESTVVSVFKGCTALTAPCQSGTKKGVIETNKLAGELVDIEGGSGVGVLLHAETGLALATFTCTELATTNVIGSLIAEQTGDIGTISKTFTDNFVVGEGLGEPFPGYKPLVNIPTHVAGGVNGEHILESEVTEFEHTEPVGTIPSGQQLEANNKGEAVEIKG